MQLSTIASRFLSTLSLRRATYSAQSMSPKYLTISIHALLAESDLSTISNMRGFSAISIHALLAESDDCVAAAARRVADFYPRSPCGERRGGCPYHTLPANHFYPRSPCGERQEEWNAYFDAEVISIHALLAESDCQLKLFTVNPGRFLSTLSLRRATPPGQPVLIGCPISIHALLAESDVTGNIVLTHVLLFLSTLSLRRATAHAVRRFDALPISIHALLAESDPFYGYMHQATY